MPQQPQLNEAGVVRIGQIITGALIGGVLIFAVISFASVQGQPPGDPTLAYVALVVSIVCIILSFVVPGITARQTLERLSADTSDQKYYAAFNTQLVVRQALREGAGFLCCIAYMSTHIWWTLGLVFVLIALMAASFPTKGRLSDWMRERRDLDSLDQ
jgi:hypothetical protein